MGSNRVDDFRKTGGPKLLGITDRRYLAGRVRKFCNDQIDFGSIGRISEDLILQRIFEARRLCQRSGGARGGAG